MTKAKRSLSTAGRYDLFVKEIEGLLAEARRHTIRSVNAILTAVYWEVGRRIVEFKQSGAARAEALSASHPLWAFYQRLTREP